MQSKDNSVKITTLIYSMCLLVCSFLIIGISIIYAEIILKPVEKQETFSPPRAPSLTQNRLNVKVNHAKQLSLFNDSGLFRSFLNEKSLVVAWCPSCSSLENEFYRRDIAFKRDIIKWENLSKTPEISVPETLKTDLPIFRIRIQAKEKNILDESSGDFCSFITDHITKEGKQGGCIVFTP